MPIVSKVTRAQIVARGLTNRCPNCGARTLFKEGTLFQVNKECPACGMPIERGTDEGFYLGSLSLNYGVTLVCFLLPIALLAYHGVMATRTAVIVALAGAVIVPALLYRPSRSWWLMNYYFFLPGHLPANGGKANASTEPL
ncbi:DUF983 domain-containing protein [Opitutus sp. ER46]|uniref:DUF983 domain-containing protein n=1 Tax=Opitutus sp. ER46 TaxID=2161864 RepID=UPI000D2FC893|nr:DUF983 domain-containing protein [Opitutus sp. ER46]PTX92265.1 DUF983 domain-containing protein [Opitutus sp. ER46]